jgi:chromosome segregation ATPase
MEESMKTQIAAAMLAATSLLGMAACDSRDYEAEIASLQGDLESARTENEQMKTELDELRSQAEAQPAVPEGARETAQTELNTAVQTAASTFERIGTMSEEPAAPAEQRTEELGTLREDMQKIVQSVQAAAEGLGLKLETVAMDTDAGATEGTPEPAAGPETQQPPAGQQQEPAAQGQQPAGQQQEQPAGQQEQPAGQQPAQ